MVKLTGSFLAKKAAPQGRNRQVHGESTLSGISNRALSGDVNSARQSIVEQGQKVVSGAVFVSAMESMQTDGTYAHFGTSLAATLSDAMAVHDGGAPPDLPSKWSRNPWWSMLDGAEFEEGEAGPSFDGARSVASTLSDARFNMKHPMMLDGLAKVKPSQVQPAKSDKTCCKYRNALARWKANERAAKHDVSRLWGPKDVDKHGVERGVVAPSSISPPSKQMSKSTSNRGPLAPAHVVELALALNEHRALSYSSYSSGTMSARSPATFSYQGVPSQDCEQLSPSSAKHRDTGAGLALFEGHGAGQALKSFTPMDTLSSERAYKPKKTVMPAWGSQGQEANKDINPAALEGLVARCPKCTRAFPTDDKAKYCRLCGEARIDNKTLAEAFLAYIGKRSILRKTDLTKMAQHLRYLNHAEDGLTRQALHRVTKEAQGAFEYALALQLKEGNPHTQGLTLEYFPIFLDQISSPRKMSLQDLIVFLMEEIRGEVHKESKEGENDTSGFEAMAQFRAMRNAVLDQCSKCGTSKTAGEKFCRKCGHSNTEEDASKPGNTRPSAQETPFAAAAPKKPGAQNHGEATADQVFSLARRYDMSVDDVRRKVIDFQEYDLHNTGFLTYAEFLDALRRHCNMDANDSIPEHLLSSMRKTKLNASLGFEEFLLWSALTEYSEEMLVTDPGERHIRQIARENQFSLTDIEGMKSIFESFDPQRTGRIHEEQFKLLLIEYWNMNHKTICKRKMQTYWREVDRNMCGTISFDDFVFWYFRSFPSS